MVEIYWLLEPETRKVRYVGCTRDAVKRVRDHWRQRNSTYRIPVKDWLCTLTEPPEFEVVQTVSDEFAQSAETYWIEMLRQTVVGPELLNVLDGRKMRAETRQKISLYQTGSVLPSEIREKISYSNRGEFNASAKLTENDVRVIRASSKSFRVLANDYGVSHTAIREILSRVTWKHIILIATLAHDGRAAVL